MHTTTRRTCTTSTRTDRQPSRSTGNELQAPMGIVILGGLISATALNMLVVPALYARFARPRTEKVASPSVDELPNDRG